MAFSFGVENPHFLPVTCLLSSVIHLTHRASSPRALHMFVLKSMTFCTTPVQKWSCLGCKSKHCVFPEYGRKISGFNPGLTFRKGVLFKNKWNC